MFNNCINVIVFLYSFMYLKHNSEKGPRGFSAYQGSHSTNSVRSPCPGAGQRGWLRALTSLILFFSPRDIARRAKTHPNKPICLAGNRMPVGGGVALEVHHGRWAIWKWNLIDGKTQSG